MGNIPKSSDNRESSEKKKKKKLRKNKPKELELDNKDLIEAKPIKVYLFIIDELLKENTRDWFYEMYT